MYPRPSLNRLHCAADGSPGVPRTASTRPCPPSRAGGATVMSSVISSSTSAWLVADDHRSRGRHGVARCCSGLLEHDLVVGQVDAGGRGRPSSRPAPPAGPPDVPARREPRCRQLVRRRGQFHRPSRYPQGRRSRPGARRPSSRWSERLACRTMLAILEHASPCSLHDHHADRVRDDVVQPRADPGRCGTGRRSWRPRSRSRPSARCVSSVDGP